MKVSIFTILGLSVTERTYEQKMRHLEKVTPLMLNHFMGDGKTRMNSRGADRVMNRFIENYAGKHAAIKTLWDECEDAELTDELARVDYERFDRGDAKKAFNQITNGYTSLLSGLLDADCRRTTRYTRLTERFGRMNMMLRYHYCRLINNSSKWCKNSQENPRKLS